MTEDKHRSLEWYIEGIWTASYSLLVLLTAMAENSGVNAREVLGQHYPLKSIEELIEMELEDEESNEEQNNE